VPTCAAQLETILLNAAVVVLAIHAHADIVSADAHDIVRLLAAAGAKSAVLDV
jgi:hypothetical protein